MLEAGPQALAEASHAVWIDLHDPTDEERNLIEQATDLRIPSRAELAEIENSSRLSHKDGTFTLSTPMVARAEDDRPMVHPLGFVLNQKRLLTVRYADLRAFSSFAADFRDPDLPHTATGAFVGLLEAMIDRLADVLEHVAASLDEQSCQVFRPQTARASGDRRADRMLNDVLISLGRSGELIGKLRDSLLGVGRILAYVAEIAGEDVPHEIEIRVRSMRADLQSLNEYDSQLNSKISFLLDATLGFINIQQNNIIKVLTVASIVGIPPTLIAGIYGMNFAAMPELKWAYGYPYSLLLMLASAVLPLAWFRRRGWL